MSMLTQRKIGAFAVTAAIGVAMVASTSAQARSPEQQIERFGNKWAPAFAAGSKRDLGQPALQQMGGCKGPGGTRIRNCTPLSSAYLKSFKDARVQDIAINPYGQAGINFGSAGVKFSNGKAVELYFEGAAPGGAKFYASIAELGGKAGRRFFK
jgi:hypothetical protein